VAHDDDAADRHALSIQGFRFAFACLDLTPGRLLKLRALAPPCQGAEQKQDDARSDGYRGNAGLTQIRKAIPYRPLA
jgi:hypothetical protein